jgi:hypothetical protein
LTCSAGSRSIRSRPPDAEERREENEYFDRKLGAADAMLVTLELTLFLLLVLEVVLAFDVLRVSDFSVTDGLLLSLLLMVDQLLGFVDGWPTSVKSYRMVIQQSRAL